MKSHHNTKSFASFAFVLLVFAAPSAGALSASSSNLAHMLAVLANDLPAFSACSPGLVAVPFMRYALFVGSAAAFAGNLFLTVGAHGCKPPVGSSAAIAVASIGDLVHFRVVVPVAGRSVILVHLILPVFIILMVH